MIYVHFLGVIKTVYYDCGHIFVLKNQLAIIIEKLFIICTLYIF